MRVDVAMQRRLSLDGCTYQMIPAVYHEKHMHTALLLYYYIVGPLLLVRIKFYPSMDT